MNNASPLWQTVFVSFALLLILFETIRGWRLGVVRQVVRLLALVLAYAGALLGGRILLPVLRPLLRLPDLFLSIFAGAILAVAIYALVNFVGALLFKRTGQQPGGLIRLFYGSCGAVLGIFFGLFSVWLVIVGIRSLGAIANAELHSRAAEPPQVAAPRSARRPGESNPLINSIARLNNSIELGPIGKTVKAVDVVPAQTYQTLGKLGTVVSTPQTAERFLNYPGARELTENPRLVALRNDPEIMGLIEQGRFLELLQNPKLIEALNDPALAAQVKSFQFQKALDYALKPSGQR
jgi:Colicin V production protein